MDMFLCICLCFFQMSLGGSSVAVVQLPGGQFQVQGVIQSAQSSVIQSPQVQAAQVSPNWHQAINRLCTITALAVTFEHGRVIALTNSTCALFRLLAQTVKTHRTRQTVESAPKRPEKFWPEGLHTGGSLADMKISHQDYCDLIITIINIITIFSKCAQFVLRYYFF